MTDKLKHKSHTPLGIPLRVFRVKPIAGVEYWPHQDEADAFKAAYLAQRKRPASRRAKTKERPDG